MNSIETKTAKLYEDIHPHIEIDNTINDYLSTLSIGKDYFDDKKILDCGFGGTGWAVDLFCRNKAIEVHGIDLNPKWTKTVSERLKNHPIQPNLITGNVLELPYNNDYFDYVHSHGVMHHTTDWKRGIEEMVRVCKPGGIIYLMLYGKFAPVGKLIHSGYRTLGKIIPYNWSKAFVNATRLMQNHEVSLLDAMYAPIEKHLSKKEITAHLQSLEMKDICFFESHKWKKKKFFSSNLMFGKNIQNVVWAKKGN
jgi:ubiquinone/menaquinone biosynthesis C-methylase UbiE